MFMLLNKESIKTRTMFKTMIIYKLIVEYNKTIKKHLINNKYKKYPRRYLQNQVIKSLKINYKFKIDQVWNLKNSLLKR